LAATDRRLAEVVAAQATAAAERVRLATAAAQAERLKHSDAVRTAVLAAVSHDLRTPLATIKASVSSLLDTTVDWSADDRDELLHTTDAAADQLDDLLANLLDLSRLQTGVVAPISRTVSIDEVVHRALIGLPRHRIRDEVPDDLPLIDTDPGLLERVLANIIGNALKHSPTERAVRVVAGVVRDDEGRRMQVRVVDHGPGVAEADRERMFAPFQRLGDVPRGAGVGLGLAVARGLAEAVGARIDVDDTPGGGLTMVVVIPLAEAQ
jgi:two-component system sensor histidine kinase KdpD